MDLPYFDDQNIPKEFHSDATGREFEKCSVCNCSLEHEVYIVEKAFKKYQGTQDTFTVFELAICLACRKNMMNDISRESMANIKKYVSENSQALEAEMLNRFMKDGLKYCLFTGKPIEDLEEYQMVGVFSNGRMVQPPMLFSDIAIEEYAEILSEKTKGFFDDFMNGIDDLPPSIRELLDKSKPPIFL